MSTVSRKPAVRVPSQPLPHLKSKQWLRSVLSSTVWQRERIDLPDRYLAIPLIVAVAGFLAVCVYSVARDLGSMDGRRVSAQVCQSVERGGQGIGSCQERR